MVVTAEHHRIERSVESKGKQVKFHAAYPDVNDRKTTRA
jgi:hypothetical protein